MDLEGEERGAIDGEAGGAECPNETRNRVAAIKDFMIEVIK